MGEVEVRCGPSGYPEGKRGPPPSPTQVTVDAGKPAKPPPPTTYCYCLTAIACLNSCNLGYDVGSVGGAALLMRDDLHWADWQLGLFVGSINLFSILGALNAGTVCDRLGRRHTFTLSCLVFMFGILVQIIGRRFWLAMVGRLFVGVGVGLGLAIDPLYISEICPPAHRGHLVSFAEIALNFGMVVGFVADFALFRLPPGANWRLMLGLGMVLPAILIVLSTTVLAESPRWLVLRGRPAEAAAVMRRTYPPGEDIDAVIADLTRHLHADAQTADIGWMAVLCPSPPVRLMLLAGVGVAVCQQASGSEALVYYTPEILEQAGWESREVTFGITVLLGLTKMAFTLIAVLRVDQYGRRPLLLISTGGITVCLVLMAAFASFPALAVPMVVAMCLFIACFSVAMGPICWVAAAEVFPTAIRAKAMSLATSANRLVSGTVAATTPPLIGALGPKGYFSLYASLALLSGLYLHRYFPETKGKSLEEVEDYFNDAAARRSGAMVVSSPIVLP